MPEITALIVKQWLDEWNEVNFAPAPPRGEPKRHFYVFSMNAYDLKRLSGIYRRDPNKPPADDEGIQRRHDPERSAEILRYIRDGFPLSRINPKRLVDPNEIPSLRMPGWIPGAVVANILIGTDKRGPAQHSPDPKHLIQVKDQNDGTAKFILPAGFEGGMWAPLIHPIEIIDGQHRLWALENADNEPSLFTDVVDQQLKSFQIPVVAFHGLDRTWQAYLFYTINQLPKKVDQSLVFDLYPLLRDQEWLERVEGPEVYRNSRAQDLVILLWSHPQSPWKDRILRHGGRAKGQVTQASFIRSLVAAFIKTYDAGKTGGLFGAYRGTHSSELDWAREQQAAFLIVAWDMLRNAVKQSRAPWATSLRERSSLKSGSPEAESVPFEGPDSLLATDQGSRVFMFLINDITKALLDAGKLDLFNFRWARRGSEDDVEAVTRAISDLKKQAPETIGLIESLCVTLSGFDWRVASAVQSGTPEYDRQASFRGSSGYKALRQYALTHIVDQGNAVLADVSQGLLLTLGYEA